MFRSRASSPSAVLPLPPALQGDVAVWIFILAELLAFGVFFLAYAFARARNPALFDAAQASLERFQAAMTAAGDERTITTEITTATPFYYAEDDHQQYLHKNPYGYCGIGGIGVCLPPQG